MSQSNQYELKRFANGILYNCVHVTKPLTSAVIITAIFKIWQMAEHGGETNMESAE